MFPTHQKYLHYLITVIYLKPKQNHTLNFLNLQNNEDILLNLKKNDLF
jgi:hypothetical protein